MGMAVFKYWCRVLRRAARATASFYGFTTQSRPQFSVTVVVYVLALLIIRLIGGTQQMSEELLWVVAISVAAAVMILPIFLVNLVLAPAQMDRLKQQKIGSLRQRIRQRLSRRQKEQQLSDLIDEGKSLVQMIIGDGQAIEASKAQVDDWKERTSQFLSENVAPNEAARFRAGFGLGEAFFKYDGANYSGDKAVLASEVDSVVSIRLAYVVIPYDSGDSDGEDNDE